MRHAIVLAAAFSLGLAPGAASQYAVLPPVSAELRPLAAKVELSGYLAVRADAGDTLAFSLQRARLTAQALPRPWLGVRLQADLAAGGQVDVDSTVGPFALTDAFIQLEPPRDSARRAQLHPRLMVGQLRVPFGQERLTPFSALQTADRSPASNQIGYGRDVGLVAELDLASRVLVSLGIFNGEGANVFSNGDGRYLGAARIGLSPVRAVGIGAQYGSDGRDRRWGGGFRLIPGRLTLEGELLERRVASASPELRARGGYLLGSYRVLGWLQPLVKAERYYERGGARQHATLLGINLLPSREALRVQCDVRLPSGDSDDPARHLLVQAILRF